MIEISTIGYADRDAEQRVVAFLAQERTVLVDIRKTPVSRWYPHFNRRALMERFGKRYEWMHEFGNINHKIEDRPKGIVLVDPQAGLSKIMKILDSGHKVMLLCACKNYTTCHRKVVYELIQQALKERDLIRAKN